MEQPVEHIRIVAVVGENSVEYLQVSGSAAVLGNGIHELIQTPEPDLRSDLALKDSLVMKIDGGTVTLADKLTDKPVYLVAVIDQQHHVLIDAPLEGGQAEDIKKLGKDEDTVWYVVPQSLGGLSLLRNIRLIGNNPDELGNLMLAKFFESMIRFWLIGLPPDSRTYVKYQVTLEYNSSTHSERPDEFSYVVQFFKPLNTAPISDVYFVLNEMVRSLEACLSSNLKVSELSTLLQVLNLEMGTKKCLLTKNNSKSNVPLHNEQELKTLHSFVTPPQKLTVTDINTAFPIHPELKDDASLLKNGTPLPLSPCVFETGSKVECVTKTEKSGDMARLPEINLGASGTTVDPPTSAVTSLSKPQKISPTPCLSYSLDEAVDKNTVQGFADRLKVNTSEANSQRNWVSDDHATAFSPIVTKRGEISGTCSQANMARLNFISSPSNAVSPGECSVAVTEGNFARIGFTTSSMPAVSSGVSNITTKMQKNLWDSSVAPSQKNAMAVSKLRHRKVHKVDPFPMKFVNPLPNSSPQQQVNGIENSTALGQQTMEEGKRSESFWLGRPLQHQPPFSNPYFNVGSPTPFQAWGAPQAAFYPQAQPYKQPILVPPSQLIRSTTHQSDTRPMSHLGQIPSRPPEMSGSSKMYFHPVDRYSTQEQWPNVPAQPQYVHAGFPLTYQAIPEMSYCQPHVSTDGIIPQSQDGATFSVPQSVPLCSIYTIATPSENQPIQSDYQSLGPNKEQKIMSAVDASMITAAQPKVKPINSSAPTSQENSAPNVAKLSKRTGTAELVSLSVPNMPVTASSDVTNQITTKLADLIKEKKFSSRVETTLKCLKQKIETLSISGESELVQRNKLQQKVKMMSGTEDRGITQSSIISVRNNSAQGTIQTNPQDIVLTSESPDYETSLNLANNREVVQNEGAASYKTLQQKILKLKRNDNCYSSPPTHNSLESTASSSQEAIASTGLVKKSTVRFVTPSKTMNFSSTGETTVDVLGQAIIQKTDKDLKNTEEISSVRTICTDRSTLISSGDSSSIVPKAKPGFPPNSKPMLNETSTVIGLKLDKSPETTKYVEQTRPVSLGLTNTDQIVAAQPNITLEKPKKPALQVLTEILPFSLSESKGLIQLSNKLKTDINETRNGKICEKAKFMPNSVEPCSVPRTLDNSSTVAIQQEINSPVNGGKIASSVADFFSVWQHEKTDMENKTELSANCLPQSIPVQEFPISNDENSKGKALQGSTESSESAEDDIIWLDGTRAPPPECHELWTHLSVEWKRESTDNETTFCDEDILSELVATKILTNDFAKSTKAKAKKRCNIFETTHTGFFCNRSAIKMANLDSDCDFTLTEPKDSHGNPVLGPYDLFYFADVYGGPGGLADYILWRKGWKTKGIGFTRKDASDYKLDKFVNGSPQNFEAYYGPYEDGCIYRTRNIDCYYERVMEMTNGVGVHIMASEGGVEGSGNYTQELKTKRLFLCKCIIALRIVRIGGTFVTNVYDLLTPFNAGLVYLMHCCFEQISIHKPNACRPANSERFLICKGKKANVSGVVKYLSHVNIQLGKLRLKDDDVRHIVDFDILSNRGGRFFKYLHDSNTRLARKQIIQLNKLIEYYNDPAKIEERQEPMRQLCLELWKIPDKPKEELPMYGHLGPYGPNEIAALLLGKDYKKNYSITFNDLKSDKLMAQLKTSTDWYCCITVGPCSDPNRKPNLFLSLGETGFYKWQVDTWAPVNIRFKIPKDTIFLGEVMSKYNENKTEVSAYILHIIDAAFLNGQDVRTLPTVERMKLCGAFARSLRQKDNLIFAPDPVLLRDIDLILKNLILFVDESGSSRLRYILHNAIMVSPGGLLCLPRCKLPQAVAVHQQKPQQAAGGAFSAPVPNFGEPTDFLYSVNNILSWNWSGVTFHPKQPEHSNADSLQVNDLLTVFPRPSKSWSGLQNFPVQFVDKRKFAKNEKVTSKSAPRGNSYNDIRGNASPRRYHNNNGSYRGAHRGNYSKGDKANQKMNSPQNNNASENVVTNTTQQSDPYNSAAKTIISSENKLDARGSIRGAHSGNYTEEKKNNQKINSPQNNNASAIIPNSNTIQQSNADNSGAKTIIPSESEANASGSNRGEDKPKNTGGRMNYRDPNASRPKRNYGPKKPPYRNKSNRQDPGESSSSGNARK